MDAVGGQWAGNYECSVCGQKRLTAASFSRKQLDTLRQSVCSQWTSRQPSLCALHACVEAAAQHVIKNSCHFLRDQGKGSGSLKCKSCVDAAVEAEQNQSAAAAAAAAATAAGADDAQVHSQATC